MEIIGKRCVVRSALAGKWIGVVVSQDGRDVVMRGAKRAGGQSDTNGYPAPSDPLPDSEVVLKEVMSVVPVRGLIAPWWVGR